MSGGHWGYLHDAIEQTGSRAWDALALLAEIEHALDYGLSNDTCYECAKERTIAALEALFDGWDGGSERNPVDIAAGHQEEHYCPECAQRKRAARRLTAIRTVAEQMHVSLTRSKEIGGASVGESG